MTTLSTARRMTWAEMLVTAQTAFLEAAQISLIVAIAMSFAALALALFRRL